MAMTGIELTMNRVERLESLLAGIRFSRIAQELLTSSSPCQFTLEGKAADGNFKTLRMGLTKVLPESNDDFLLAVGKAFEAYGLACQRAVVGEIRPENNP